MRSWCRSRAAGMPPVANIAPITVDADMARLHRQICVPEQRHADAATCPQATPAARCAVRRHGARRFRRCSIQRAICDYRPTRCASRSRCPPASTSADPHVFIEQTDVIDYAAPQSFYRDGDMLVAEIPRGGLRAEPVDLRGILAFDDAGRACASRRGRARCPPAARPHRPALLSRRRLAAVAGRRAAGRAAAQHHALRVPDPQPQGAEPGARWRRADDRRKIEGLAYTAGVVLACACAGRAAAGAARGGAQVGWAFQLQEPLVVVALLVLATLITANFAGLFEMPSPADHARAARAAPSPPACSPPSSRRRAPGRSWPRRWARRCCCPRRRPAAVRRAGAGPGAAVPAARLRPAAAPAAAEAGRVDGDLPQGHGGADGADRAGAAVAGWRLGGTSFAFAALALRHRLPVVGTHRRAATATGLSP